MNLNNTINQFLFNGSDNSRKPPLMTMHSPIDNSVPLENRTAIMATFISLYALIFFFGITGNALVVCK